MSGPSQQRMRRNASPSTKQGPLKATKAFPTVNRSPTRTKSGIRSSPISSPISWSSLKTHRLSPDNRHSPERTASSPSFKVEKPKPLRPSSGPNLKRASSLDTIGQYYQIGQWPKDLILPGTSQSAAATSGAFMVDQSTQTDEAQKDTQKDQSIICDHSRSSSLGSSEQLNKEFYKQRLQRTKDTKSEHTKPRQSPVPGSHAALSTPPPHFSHKGLPIPASTRVIQPKHPQSSVEALNPEIEKLVLHTISDEDRNVDSIPDGHRAPLPETPRSSSCTRSVDTQTPSSVPLFTEETSSQVECRSQSVSPAIPIMAGQMDTSRPSSRTDSTDSATRGVDESPELTTLPKYTTSPKPNNSYSFVREPPDGCEKVKVIEEPRRPAIKEPLLITPLKANQFVLKPSDGSAFLPLPKMCVTQENHLRPPSPAFVQPVIETQ